MSTFPEQAYRIGGNRPPRPGLDDRDEEILAHFELAWVDRVDAPTVGDLAAMLGIKSRRAVAARVAALVKRGWLEPQPRLKPRAYRLTVRAIREMDLRRFAGDLTHIHDDPTVSAAAVERGRESSGELYEMLLECLSRFVCTDSAAVLDTLQRGYRLINRIRGPKVMQYGKQYEEAARA